ncbi:MAG: hypothetical protein WDW38_003870 [Sanguina aurantia]
MAARKLTQVRMMHAAFPALDAATRPMHLDSQRLRKALALIPTSLITNTLCLVIERHGPGVRRRALQPPGETSAIALDGVGGIPYCQMFGGTVGVISHCFGEEGGKAADAASNASPSLAAWGDAYLSPALIEAAKLTLLASNTEARFHTASGLPGDPDPDLVCDRTGALAVLTRALRLESLAFSAPSTPSGPAASRAERTNAPAATTSDTQLVEALRDMREGFPNAVRRCGWVTQQPLPATAHVQGKIKGRARQASYSVPRMVAARELAILLLPFLNVGLSADYIATALNDQWLMGGERRSDAKHLARALQAAPASALSAWTGSGDDA